MARQEPRFVRVVIDPAGPAWGLLDDELADFLTLWAEDMDAVRCELGLESNGLTISELLTVEPADEDNTPDEAWAALAKWRLTDG